ncbi:protein DpdJ [Peribacillus simplex]|uniref:protein DpdJ n=1 Tax=Peribacillus simplex TaxID=1478 RepID=UPI0024C14802|nr:protein DpdJ [Peribacillus simplex]WHY58648.1 protein DpdJ [Peribacillus simplex]
MERTDLDRLAEEVLTQLELEENNLLTWGIIGGSFNPLLKVEKIIESSPTQFIGELWSKLEDQGIRSSDIIKNLVDRKLLFKGKTGYRSRYAETVRLLYLLKQRFKFTDWLSAPNLVSNIKTNLKYRNYPKRDQNWNQIRSKLRDEQFAPFILSALDELLEHGNLKLSVFQVESLLHLLKEGKKSTEGGTIIGAGTGSGKTKSFYLPAFSQISQSIKDDSRTWTRMLAIYPRTELLKDQYSEALSEVLKLNNLFHSQSIRPISIGCYYGDTPDHAEEVRSHENRKWQKKQDGYVCPSLVCPNCGSDLIWKTVDLEKVIATNEDQYEKLYCTGATCHVIVESQNIILTRKRMIRQQPDILFTTTEMLNRKLSSGYDQHLFGIRSDRKPPLFVLLDEVHIYNGINGAHVSYVLKRWKNLVKKYADSRYGIQFVGLSATLPNPQYFFSQLVGISENSCKYVTPNPEDMTDEGMEYNLVLRGDPFSSTALLSTSVQTAMLLGRMLDPLGHSTSNGAFGSKIFGFTDKLDVINRWYHIEKSAEEDLVLSQYRDWEVIKEEAPQLEKTKKYQFNAGQVWELAKRIDPVGLQNPMKIAITSSQYKGVDSKAKFVVATSTLEVGYNDPAVGAVIQHKAPRNLASFLQRKGRAGRKRGTRPWTVVVVSSYGRDRFVYDFPEQLFSPNLPDLSLPVRNVYVQRIQAGFAVMDWFSVQLKQQGFNQPIWNVLSPQYKSYQRERRVISDLVMDILDGNDQEFILFMKSALQVDENHLNQLLWTPPRSIMFDLFPTLLNHLSMDWARQEGNKELPTSPLQGYVPRNLFSTLEVNELELWINKDQKRVHYQALQQGIKEFAPGNVSKRYAKAENIKEAQWLPVSLDKEIIDMKEGHIVGRFINRVEENDDRIDVYLPLKYELLQIPYELSDRTTGILDWNVKVLTKNHAETEVEVDIPLLSQSALKSFFTRIHLFSSNELQTVTFTRYATKCNVEIKYKDGKSERKVYHFTYGSSKGQTAMGFQVDVDAIVFKLADIDLEQIKFQPEWEQLLTELRPRFYLDMLQNDLELASQLSIFEIEWLWQICLSSTIATSVSKQCGIKEAVEIYREQVKAISLRALNVIFQSTAVKIEDNDQAEEAKLYKRLLSHLDDEGIMERFIARLDLLYVDITEDEAYYPWIMERLHTTIAACIKQAVEQLLPDINTEDINIDIKDHQIWLSETDSGGMGVISSIASAMSNEPRLFEDLFFKAVDDCPRNDISKGLSSIVDHFNDPDFYETISIIRKATNLDEQKQQLELLRKQLSDRGITPNRELFVSFTTKLLHNNNNQMTDELMKDLQELWRREERRLECKIDLRVFTVACLRLDDIKVRIDSILENLYSSGNYDEKQRLLLVETLLWNDCNDSCPECLNLYSPYQSFAKPSRLLLKSVSKPTKITIDSSKANWSERLMELLKKGNQVCVWTSFEEMEECQRILVDIIQTPIDFDYEFYYPYISGVHSKGSNWLFDVRVREVTHA